MLPVISQQKDKMEFKNSAVQKEGRKKRKSEQRPDMTNGKQRARFRVQTNHINNGVKCKWSKIKCGDCQIR